MAEARIEKITPNIARLWLDGNTSNFRSLDKERVKHYADEIKRNRWHLNGASISFAEDGSLSDGQHRLHAVIVADTAIESVVVRGVNPGGEDRGKGRTLGQWLKHHGVKNANKIAAITRKVIAYDKGLWAQRSWGIGVMADSEVLDYALLNQQAMNRCIHFPTVPGIHNSDICTVMYIGSGRRGIDNSALCTWFIEGLTQGVGLAETDAVLHLRNRLANPNESRKLSSYMARVLLTLAWNKTVLGEECKNLKIAMTGPTASKPPSEILIAEE